LIHKRIIAWFKRIPKQDALCILIIISAVIPTRLLVILNTPFLYGQDAYSYVSEARDFASTGAIRFREGMPFVFFLGVFLKIFGPLFGDINASRFFSVLASTALIIIVYLIGKKLSGRLLGLVAAFLATFEPYLLAWSTVPYRDAFAISAGLLSIYFVVSDKKLQTFLAPVFFYIAVFTRAELYVALVIPILFFYLVKAFKMRSKGHSMPHLLVTFILSISLYALPSIGVYFYVRSWGALGLVQRLALFLTPNLLSKTVDLSFRFYGEQLQNQVISLLVELVLGLSALNIFVHFSFKKQGKKFPISIQFEGAKRIKDALFSEKGMTAIILFLVSVTYIFVLTIFAYGYNWAFYVAPSDMTNVDILRQAVIIIPSLPGRYLFFIRLLMSYPLAYPLVLVTRKVWDGIAYEK